MYINNIARRWQLFGGIIFQFARDWDKIRGNNFPPITRDWDKIRGNNFPPICEDWKKSKRE